MFCQNPPCYGTKKKSFLNRKHGSLVCGQGSEGGAGWELDTRPLPGSWDLAPEGPSPLAPAMLQALRVIRRLFSKDGLEGSRRSVTAH